MQTPAPFLAIALFCLSATLPVHGADNPPGRRVLTPDDFYNMQTITDPQVSPDGKWVAYVVSTNDRDADESRAAIWMVSWDGAQQVQLTNPAHETSSPRWSQDGRYLAYLSVPAGTDKDKSQIMLLDRRGGEPKGLTTVTDDIESYEWAPDSQRLVVVMEPGIPKPKTGTGKDDPTPGDSAKKDAESPQPVVIDSLHFKQDKDGYLGSGHNRHLYLLTLGSKGLEPLTSDVAFNEDLPAWSADSRRIAFLRSGEKGADADSTAELDLIDAQPGARPTALLRVNIPQQQKLAWSPDGKGVAFLQGAEAKYGQYGQDRVAIVKASGGTAELLADSLERDATSYVFNKDGSSITATVEDDGTAYPIVVNLRTHAIKKLPQGLSVVSDLSTAVGHTAALCSNDSSPAEVCALEGEHVRKLTRHNDAFIARLQLGAVEDLRFKSADGTPIHGLLVKPP